MNKKNSGFSLVELIVVIAIMAVLVGVLAPAYLKYVEKSRKSTDISAVADMITAASTVAADVEYDVQSGTVFTITGQSKKITLTVGASGDEDTTDYSTAQSGWRDVADVSESGYKLKSKDYQKAADATGDTIKGTVQDTGAVTWAVPTSETSLFGKMCKYSKDLKGKFSGQ